MNWLFRSVSSGTSPDTTRRVERSRTTGSIESQNCAERLRNYRDLAEDALERAYEAELAGNFKSAIRRYELGLSAIKEGLGQKAVENGLGPQYDNVARWHREMSQWQLLAKDRLKDLKNPSKRNHAPSDVVTRIAKHPNINTGLQRLKSPNGSTPFKSKVIEKGSKDSKLRETILAEVLDKLPDVGWSDIAGLEKAKQALQEMVVLPALRADLFQGLRSPARGLLLYGPPGNGKTLLARALAGEAQATFFNISASSLTSKWHGEAEKLVRTLFEVATEMQPSIIFIDEIDSILSERSSGEHEASRRLKTQFLVELDGVTKGSDRVVVIGATNRPQELDDAVRRRLVKRVYVPMPDNDGREALLRHILKDQRASLTLSALKQIASATEGYSGSDLAALCREAAMQPIRQLGPRVSTVPANEIRPIMKQDFDCAMTTIRPSVSRSQLESFEEWTRSYGSSA